MVEIMKGIDFFKTAIFGCDHAGFELKEELKNYFEDRGFAIKDVNSQYENPIHYGQSALKVSKQVLENKNNLGILVCGTGIGISIAANRMKGIKAALLYDDFAAEYARKHNNANILVFGGRTMEIEQTKKRIDIFLAHQFAGGKYQKRNIFLQECGIEADELEQIFKEENLK